MKIATHSGVYHADDIFAVGALALVFKDAEIVRTRDEEILNQADVVVDVGKVYDPSRLRFDHHQEGGAGSHPNGIPYASFGLVWKEFGEKLSGSREVCEMINEKLVSPIDALDNGVIVCVPVFDEKQVREYSISDFFYSYVDHSKMDEAHLLETFKQMVEVAKGILAREIAKAEDKLKDNDKVKKIYASSPDKRLIIFDEMLAWKDVLVLEQEPLYVVHPRVEGTWGIRAVPKKLEEFEVRKPFPEAWRGKDEDDLRTITGVPGAIFCHNAGFIAVARDRDSAIALASKALNQ